MSTHNICFHGLIRKILCGYSLLSGAIRMIFNSKHIFRVTNDFLILARKKGPTFHTSCRLLNLPREG